MPVLVKKRKISVTRKRIGKTAAIVTINPSTGRKIQSYRLMTDHQIKSILSQTQQVFLEWRMWDFERRAQVLKKAAQILRGQKDIYARLMAEEMGKPLTQGQTEIEKCAWVCDFYSDEAKKFLSPEIIPTEAKKSFVTFQPLGVIFAIMPWNFPFWQVFRFLAPALMAGNTAVLKHSPNTTGCAWAMEKILKEAGDLTGAPAGLFRTLVISVEQAAQVIAHPLVKAVTLTGSTRAGKDVASKAGAVLKKTVLELGGSDPYLILEDADLAAAAQICASSRLINCGQSCVAAKRFIVVQPLKKRFEELFVEQMKSFKMGDPFAEGIQLGPMARFDLRDQLHRQVLESVRKGAKLLLGGVIPNNPGAFYPATVLTDVRKGSPAYEDELFGPVASIISAQDEQQAAAIANQSPYGLGAALFTRDLNKGERLAADVIEAGCCFVNTSVKSDPRLPFGGIKESGYGRELSSFGIREFVNIKTVYVA